MSIIGRFSENIVDDKKFIRLDGFNHIRVECDNFVQYKCNPSKEDGMREIPSDITGFRTRAMEVNGHVFSYVVEAIGPNETVTFHYQA